MDASRYRPDIDGLRAIAVISVLAYHVGIDGFGGGFVGVDIFFVISGFLITRLIVDEVVAQGSFDFARFYVRRIRRLFPALFATTAASFVAALVLLAPEDLQRFAASATAAILSVSNFYFWAEADYFDVAAQTKPMLHTWSLGVEEQFYLIWPATLVLLLRGAPQWRAPVVLALFGAASLAIAEHWLRTDPAAAFYLLPARIVEFVAGAAVVWLLRARVVGPLAREGLLAAGLALIALPIVTFTTETPFPGWRSLIPCAGVALAIYAGTAPRLGWALSNSISVAIGRSSYSIYLVHWPLLVFYRAVTYAALSPGDKLALVALSICLGWLQYRLVEQTFRYARPGSLSPARFTLAAALLALVIVLPSWAVMRGHGWTWRVPGDRLVASDNVLRRIELHDYCRRRDPTKPPDLFTCQNFRGKDRDIIIWGDSHALHLVAGFSEAYPDYNVYVIFLNGCMPQSGSASYVHRLPTASETDACVERNRKALAFLAAYRPSHVVLSAAKRATPARIAGPTNAVVRSLRAAGHEAFVLGDFIRPARSLVSCTSVPAVVISDEAIGRRCVGIASVMAEEMDYNDALAALVESFVNPNEVQCPGGKCAFSDGQKLLYRDDHHLSPYGSTVMIKRLRNRLPM